MFKLVTTLKKTKAGVRIVEPPASCYFDAIGAIWLQGEEGGYFDAPTGQVNVVIDAPPNPELGGYFDRV